MTPSPVGAPDPNDLAEFRVNFASWLRDRDTVLAALSEGGQTASEQVLQARRLQELLFTSGWGRHGWPEDVGGLGGSILLRGIVAEELTKHGCPPPFVSSMIEVLGPAVVKFGSPELVSEFFPRLLNGTDIWCQGFSEPEAGSDLGSLRTKAVDAGDHWLVSGQKIWTSYAADAQRCLLLARTGGTDEGFKGITALFVDMDSPGIEVRPLKAMTGDEEFAELFLDQVPVPKERTLGLVGGGAAVTMNILGNERSVLAWQRQAWLHSRLRDVVTDLAPTGPVASARIGQAYLAAHALRLTVRSTFHKVANEIDPASETSVDKMLLSTAEKGVFDTALEIDSYRVLFGEDLAARSWRYDHTYARASSIYGGTAEIQRNIVAERLLGLPRER